MLDDKLEEMDVVESKADEIKAREELVANTEERLKNIFEDEESKESTPDETSADSEEEKSEESRNKESDNNSTPTDDKSAEQDDSEKDEESKESTPDETSADSEGSKKGIPDAYYRAAKHQGWSDDDIAALHKANPALAEKTFAKLYDSTNKLSREFSAIGRAKLQAKKAQPAKTEPTGTEPKKSEFKKIDIDKLRKDYDNDPIVELVAQMQDQFEQLHSKLDKEPAKTEETPAISEQELRAKIQEEAAMEQQIEQFFNADDLKQYKEFYGDLPKNARNWDILSTQQKTNRWEVLQRADEILIGAEAQGREMGIDEALKLAHLIISEPMREKVIRENIKAKVVKRQKSLTLKPTGKMMDNKTGPLTRDQLVERTKERLSKMKW